MNALVVHSGATSEDIFFGQEPVVTDWDDVYNNIEKLNVDNMVAEIKEMEPFEETDPDDHKLWVLQQKIRIALRLKADKPYLLDRICPTCGTHKVDSIQHECLWCAEYSHQILTSGSRGSCQFINSVYDTKSRSWGLLYYWSHCDDTFMFWLAIGFKTSRAADMAMYPLSLYENWLRRKYKSMYHGWHLDQELFDLAEMMKTPELPWYPKDFEKQLRRRIHADMTSDKNLLDYYIKDAQWDYERDHRD